MIWILAEWLERLSSTNAKVATVLGSISGILWHSGIWGAPDEAVLIKGHQKSNKKWRWSSSASLGLLNLVSASCYCPCTVQYPAYTVECYLCMQGFYLPFKFYFILIVMKFITFWTCFFLGKNCINNQLSLLTSVSLPSSFHSLPVQSFEYSSISRVDLYVLIQVLVTMYWEKKKKNDVPREYLK